MEHQCFNHDIAGIWARAQRYIEECQDSQSASVHAVSDADMERMESYIKDMTEYVNWVVGVPALDLPKTHPRLANLKDPTLLKEIESILLADCIRLWEIGAEEVIASQSARNATGLLKFDVARLRAVIEKTSKLMTEYIAKVQPLDMPESTPSVDVTK